MDSKEKVENIIGIQRNGVGKIVFLNWKNSETYKSVQTLFT